MSRWLRLAHRLASTVGGVLLIGSMATVLACEREAPGPEECERFALRALGVTDERLLALPRVKAAHDALVVQCLTTPFDRELVRCIEETQRTDACLVQFQRRRAPRELPAAR